MLPFPVVEHLNVFKADGLYLGRAGPGNSDRSISDSLALQPPSLFAKCLDRQPLVTAGRMYIRLKPLWNRRFVKVASLVSVFFQAVLHCVGLGAF